MNGVMANALPGQIDLDKLRQGVEQANIPTLLMVLVQLTGDEKWLQEPYVPRRGRGLDDNDTGNLSLKIQKEIRSAACDAITGWARVARCGSDFLLDL